MLSFLLLLAVLAIIILIKISQPFAWAMTRLRLIYPIITICVYIYLDLHPEWKITQFVKIEPFPNNDAMIMDIILLIVVILSAASLLKELIQMVLPDFTWFGLFTLPQQIKNRKNNKLLQKKHHDEHIHFIIMRDEVYKFMPDMEKEYFYFEGKCTSEEELSVFESDWKEYIIAAHSRLTANANDLYTFDEWYGDNEKWRTGTYYKEYLEKERQQRMNQ